MTPNQARAWLCYSRGGPESIVDGIACFDSLDDALEDANDQIQHYTKSDFMYAHYFDAVKMEVLRQMSNPWYRMKKQALDTLAGVA